ncbi:glycosyltransferase [Mariniluteicoccus flavus]
MKILIGTDTYPPTVNGAAQSSHRLAVALARRGNEVHVVCPSPNGRPGRMVDPDGLTLHHVRSVAWPAYKTFPLCIPGSTDVTAGRVMDEVKPDVVHVQDHFLLAGRLVVAARKRGIPVVATNHLVPSNFWDHVPLPVAWREHGARLLWWDVRRVFKLADVLTSPTPRAVELLTEATGLPAIPVSNGVDIDTYETAAKSAVHGEEPVVLFVGRLDQEKRVNELIEAFARLPKDLPGRCEIVGSGSMAQPWRELAERLGVTDRVTFRGFISDEELYATYGRSDIFCMPSVADLQSLVTLEAMSASMPVVLANAMALPHLVREGENGFLFEPTDIDGLAGHLETLLRDAELRRRMGAVSREMVSQHALGATIDTFEEIYRGLVARR